MKENTIAEMIETGKKHFMNTYAQLPIVLSGGKGSYILTSVKPIWILSEALPSMPLVTGTVSLRRRCRK